MSSDYRTSPLFVRNEATQAIGGEGAPNAPTPTSNPRRRARFSYSTASDLDPPQGAIGPINVNLSGIPLANRHLDFSSIPAGATHLVDTVNNAAAAGIPPHCSKVIPSFSENVPAIGEGLIELIANDLSHPRPSALQQPLPNL